MSVEDFKNSLTRVKRNKDLKSSIAFLNSLSQVVPPGEDFAVTVGRVGGYEYMVDRHGGLIISATQDEYLPFFSARPKRVSVTDFPERILRDIPTNLKEILDGLRDAILEWRKTGSGEYLKLSDEILGVIVENV
ncbi:hypothetical protein HS7_10210 [Sulfolobales archaeon HS-7]|nr:hypothetical protein HS7_10210 [Sulfolobales archaeon HS-7]